MLWPRWLARSVAPNAPSLPIIVGGTAFNVPPAAIRRPMQRQPGVAGAHRSGFPVAVAAPPRQRRCEAGPTALPPAQEPQIRSSAIFVTDRRGATARPRRLERMQTIYRRYLAPETLSAPERADRCSPSAKDTPYQGEDLLYDARHARAFPAALHARRRRADARHLPA